jgi:PAS domain S-box-containing protein
MLTDDYNAPLILVVEDDDSHASLIRRSFEYARDRHRLEIVGTLLDAGLVIQRHPPALVLTDYRLPDGDGIELVTMVNRACPVILMTSQGNEQVAATSIKAGALDYIVKSAEAFSSMPQIVRMALQEWNLIQERRKIHDAVSRAKREWEQTFDAVPDLIFIIDSNHTITRANRAMAERCGLNPEELVGRKCHELFHDMMSPPDFCPHIMMILDGHEHTEEVEEKKLAGFFDVTVSPLYDDEGNITACVHVARDITERKQAEQDRLALEKQFQQAQKLESLGVLAGGIAHDFNNILTIIIGRCFFLKEDIESGTGNISHVQEIEGAAKRAADLCRQMLTYAGKSPIVQTRINIGLVVDEVVNMLKSVIKKNVAFELELQQELPVIVGDKTQIQQVVMNLIINAAESISDNNGTVRVKLAKMIVTAGQDDTDFFGNAISAGEYVSLEVSDTGCGMDEEMQKRIFEPFFTTKFTGRGLGMSAILGIVKSHGSALQLSSKPGEGTTFKVFFPVYTEPDYVEAPQTAGAALSAKRRATILLVDDEPQLRTIAAAMLKSMGFSAITAANGREALEIFQERGSLIDLIFMDLIMPEMGGIEAYHELRKIAPSIPIVICSGYDKNEIASSINDDEHAGFVLKPFQPDHLFAVITGFLETAG